MSGALQPGSTLSHYRIISPLGAGGMGEVYMAQDETLERAVALKVLPPELVKSEERVRRFIQEAKSASSLSHPHIVTIYEIGKAEVRSGGDDDLSAPSEPIHFIAMELISGETLKQKIHGERTDLRTLLRYLAQAAEGIAKAHAAGIVHRDLKPENIMISRDGYAKVLDFGLAKLTERSETGGDRSATRTAAQDGTREGAVLGTVAYMSPEQVQGKSVDHRSDIFSFGAILYEAATRVKPFVADSDVEVMHKILRDKTAPIEESNSEVPAELRRLVRRCMAKSPDQRLQSMKDLSLELGEIAEEYESLSAAATSAGSGSGGSAPAGSGSGGSGSSGSGSSGSGAAVPIESVPTKGGLGGRWILAAVAVLGIAGIGVGVFSILRPGTSTKNEAVRFDSMKIARLTTRGSVQQSSLSPDGKYLAHSVKEAGNESLWVRQIATGSDVQIVPPLANPVIGITFSPDGNYVYYVNQETGGPGYSVLYQVPSLGGAARKILFDIDTGVSFSPDGKRLVFCRGYPDRAESALMVASSDGTGERKLVVRKGGTLGLVMPSWSPDGHRIAFVGSGTEGGNHSEIVLADAETGKETPFGAKRWGFLNGIAWLPDGSGLMITGFTEENATQSQVWLVSTPGGEARKVSNDLNTYSGVSVTADSKTLVTTQFNSMSDLWVTALDGKSEPRQVTSSQGVGDGIFSAAAGSDRIVFVANKGELGHLFSMPLTGGPRTQLTPDTWEDSSPVLSPDGRILVFQSRREDGLGHIWKADPDGGNPAQVSKGDGETPLAVSPDGKWVLYSSGGSAGAKAWRVNLSGGPPILLGTQFLGRGGISPDGSRVVYEGFVQGGALLRRNMIVIPAGGGPPERTILFESGNNPGWAPSGDALTYVLEKDGVDNIWSQPLSGGPPRQLTRFTSLKIFSYDWTPDGKLLVLARGKIVSDAVILTGFH
jgi:serine/threonine protein kinase/Tol biopolymer transport system component